MKKRFLNILTVFSLVLLGACTKDYLEGSIAEDSLHTTHDFRIFNHSLTELEKTNKSLGKMLREKQLIRNTSGYNSTQRAEEGFALDTENILVVQNQGSTSYTFGVNRVQPTNYLENVVLHKVQDQYKAYLVTYELPQEDLRQVKSVQEIEDKIRFEEIDSGLVTTQSSAKEIYEVPCLIDVSYQYGESCASGQHSFEDGASCSYWGGTGAATQGGFVYTYGECEVGGNSGGGGSVGTGPRGGGGGLSTTFAKKPCESLKKTSEDDDFDAIIQDLKQKAADGTQEFAYMGTSTDGSDDINFSTPIAGPNDGTEVDLTINNNIQTVIHNHYDNGETYKVPSFSDIYAFGQMLQTSNLPDHQVSMMVVTNIGIFALKVNNGSALVNALPELELKLSTLDYLLNSFISKKESKEKQIKNFLTFISRTTELNTLGIKLYERGSNGDWSELQFNRFDGSIRKKPCK